MSIRKQPCRRRDGGTEVDGDMGVASIKTKTLSIKIKIKPFVVAIISASVGLQQPEVSRVQGRMMSKLERRIDVMPKFAVLTWPVPAPGIPPEVTFSATKQFIQTVRS